MGNFPIEKKYENSFQGQRSGSKFTSI